MFWNSALLLAKYLSGMGHLPSTFRFDASMLFLMRNIEFIGVDPFRRDPSNDDGSRR